LTTKRPRGLRARPSFTLVEVMAVVAILGVLSSLSISRISGMVDRAREARAIEEIRLISIELSAQDTLPQSLAGIGRGGMLDPWGRPYQYLLFPPPNPHGHGSPPPAGARKDRFLVPINSLFDLYSMGADGQTTPPLTAAISRDDIIYANDGGYIGRASGY
jgi:general secretion pathway protein G